MFGKVLLRLLLIKVFKSLAWTSLSTGVSTEKDFSKVNTCVCALVNCKFPPPQKKKLLLNCAMPASLFGIHHHIKGHSSYIINNQKGTLTDALQHWLCFLGHPEQFANSGWAPVRNTWLFRIDSSTSLVLICLAFGDEVSAVKQRASILGCARMVCNLSSTV